MFSEIFILNQCPAAELCINVCLFCGICRRIQLNTSLFYPALALYIGNKDWLVYGKVGAVSSMVTVPRGHANLAFMSISRNIIVTWLVQIIQDHIKPLSM